MIGIERIVIDLAKNGPAVGYQIAKRSGIVRSSTYNGLKQLLEEGIVESHPVPECKGFLKKKEYSLTVLGFIHAIIIIRPEEWQSVMKTWSDLIPLVTGKWSLFVSAGVEDLARWKLQIAAGAEFKTMQHIPHGISLDMRARLGMARSGLQYTPYRMSLDQSTDPIEIFCHNFYHPEIGLNDREERLRWAEACATDPEVREYLVEKLVMIIESYEVMAHEAEIMMRTLQDKDTVSVDP